MSQSPRSGRAAAVKNVTEAREELHALVKLAEGADARPTLIDNRGVRALLAPLDRFPAARRPDSNGLPTHSLGSAQKELGDLIALAAQGQPQILKRYATPVAVLLPVDGPIGSIPSDTAAHHAATAGGAVTSQPTPSRERGRRLATLGDALGDVLTSGAAPGLSFGLTSLDEATGGLHPGRLVLVAAPPQVGGSLIGLAAARHTALVHNGRVLYAASGPNRADITRRIIAAEAGGNYARLKSGTLTPHEQEVFEQLRHAPLLIDDGSDLTAEAIAETAPLYDDLTLVVVDRLQRAHNPRLPLSGEHLPAASQVLRELARTQHVPVLVVLDTDDPAVVNLLDADVILTVTALPDAPETTVKVAERDLGIIGSARLRPDLAHARFLDAGTAPVGGTSAEAPAQSAGSAVEQELGELAEAALPYTSGAQQGLPASLTHVLAALRTALANDDHEALAELRPSLTQAVTSVPQLPDTAEGRRLTTALRAYSTTAAASSTEQLPARGEQQQTPTARQEATAAVQPTADTAQAPEDGDEGDAWVKPGEEEEPPHAVFPALKILKDGTERSTFHPILVIRKEDRGGEPWTIFREVMDGEPRWVHPGITTEKTKAGKRDRLIVPEQFGTGQLCTIDRNGSYPSACSAVPLAPNKLLHTGPMDEVGKDRAGAFLITVPAWNHPNMPHPLGRLAERTDDQDRVWVTTPHVRQLQKLIKDGHITGPLVVHDSWTGKANESLFKPFYLKAREARAELVQTGGEPYTEYKRRLSIALRLLWPKGEKVNSPFWRPDWRMAMVAEASVRHWSVAWRAVQAGHTLVALRNVDEAVFWTPDGTAPDTYKVGTGFGEVKVKTGSADGEN
ncbi:DnaB-like helicase C-terminal domain-containing protein [Streptomyces sp. NPDC048275]|uniref:DnaB-like helicase C-terminal domain-containing protein n=1 Tax=Streptomyces sp. NPDC048275 TaxID=3155629 RepID=UPI0033CE37D4